jgi:hypothetical protein
MDAMDYPTLEKIAIKLFTMVMSSVASEHNFSTMGFIHSKLRNALATRIVEKLVFIKLNLSAFYDYPTLDNDVVEYINESDGNATTALDDLAPEDTHGIR